MSQIDYDLMAKNVEAAMALASYKMSLAEALEDKAGKELEAFWEGHALASHFLQTSHNIYFGTLTEPDTNEASQIT